MRPALALALAVACLAHGCALRRSGLADGAGPGDARPPEDGGSSDAAPRDALVDASPLDVGRRDAGPPDAGPRDTGPPDTGPPDTGPPPPPFCDATDPTLTLCLEMDGAATDGSMYAHGVMASGLTFAPGVRGEAAILDLASSLWLADSPALSSPQLTIESWVRLDTVPAAGRVGVADKDGTWGVFILAGGLPQCRLLTAMLSCPALSTGWTHLACTYDGATVALYRDGARCAEVGLAGALADLATPLHLGENAPTGDDQLVGALDDLRVFSVARTAAEVCEAAGAAGCPP